jgi:hypothetical protein
MTITTRRVALAATALIAPVLLVAAAAPAASAATVRPAGEWYYNGFYGSGTTESAATANAFEAAVAAHCDPVRVESVTGSGSSWTAEELAYCET